MCPLGKLSNSPRSLAVFLEKDHPCGYSILLWQDYHVIHLGQCGIFVPSHHLQSPSHFYCPSLLSLFPAVLLLPTHLCILSKEKEF